MRRTILLAGAFLVGLPAQAMAQDNQRAQDCLADLTTFNQELVDIDYGMVGPYGYGRPSPGYGGALSTPRGEMRATMRAAYVFGMNGNGEACRAVLDGMQQLRDDYQQSVADAGTTAEEVDSWREQWLASAVDVTEVDSALERDFVEEASVRNAQGEWLGDVEDRLVAPETGETRYVLVSTDGFLGLGEDLVPIPWDVLEVTPLPYRDTFVVDVPESVMESAPRFETDDPEDIDAADIQDRVDSFWSQHVSSS